jgi:hypothetical protein
VPESAVGMRLDIELEPDADEAELEFAAAQLRQELLELDVDAVERPPGEPAPPGARGVEAGLLGTLLVAAGKGAIGAVVHTIQGWVARRPSRKVKLTLDGDSIELTNASEDEQRLLIESFLARHESDRP